MKPGFNFPDDVDVWQRLQWDFTQHSRSAHFVEAVARLAPGTSLEQARAATASLATRLGTEFAASNKGWAFGVVPLLEDTLGYYRPALWVLFGAVGLLFVIGCLNVASLLLTRALGREREVTVRVALGAAPRQLVTQLLAESFLLSLAGAAAGLLVALRRPAAHQRDDARGSAAPCGRDHQRPCPWRWRSDSSRVMTMVFGLVPAVLLVKKIDRRGAAIGRARQLAHRARHLSGARDCRKSRWHARCWWDPCCSSAPSREMTAVRLGVERRERHRLARADCPPTHRHARRLARGGQKHTEISRSDPAVARHHVRGHAPTSCRSITAGAIRWCAATRRPCRRSSGRRRRCTWPATATSKRWARRSSSGRAFTPHDTAATEPVVIVNEEFVKRHYPDRTPVGEEILTWTSQIGPLGRNLMWARESRRLTRMQPRLRIVGVVATFRTSRSACPWSPRCIYPTRQFPFGAVTVAIAARDTLGRRDRAQERAEGRVAEHAGGEDRNVGRPLPRPHRGAAPADDDADDVRRVWRHFWRRSACTDCSRGPWRCGSVSSRFG